MGAADDAYERPLPGHEALKWSDHIIAATKSNSMQRDPQTGAVYSPQRRWMENRIQQRQDEAKQAASSGTAVTDDTP